MEIKLHIVAFMIGLVFLSSSSCSLKGGPDGKREIVELRINHYQQTAVGVGPQLVLLVQEEEEIGGEDWSYFYDPIKRFDFEPGFIYDLIAQKIELENPPQDGSTIQYILVAVRSKEKVSEEEQFEIGLKRFGENFVHGSNPEFSLLGEYDIDCSNLCDELEDKIGDDEFTGNFTHGPDRSLILQSLN